MKILSVILLCTIATILVGCDKQKAYVPEYEFQLDYIRSTRYGTYIVEDDFGSDGKFDYLLAAPAKPERPYYLAQLGYIGPKDQGKVAGVLKLRSSDAIRVPFGTDYEVEIQQEFAVPSLLDEPDPVFEWNGDYQLIARFIGETVADLIPKKERGIDTYYEIALAQFDPFTAANPAALERGLVFTTVFHDPKLDRDIVEEVASVDWDTVGLDIRNPSLSLRLDLSKSGLVTAFYSSDREASWRELGRADLPNSNFRGEIITGAFGDPTP